VDSIWAQPAQLLEQRDRWPALAAALELTTADLEKKLTGRETRQFVYLRRHLAPNVAERILQLGVPGVYSQREYRRYYPDAEVTSHLLGFTDIDDTGQEGLEKVFDSQLRGIPGQKRVIKDRLGRIVQDVESIQPPQPGQKLTLSIDRRLQYHAYRALKAAFVQHNASAASAVIVDVKTGEILAMVNQPAGNPNNREELKSDLFATMRSRTLTNRVPP
jgi:cell division protein FtsI (penicillin-binding protein 3)